MSAGAQLVHFDSGGQGGAQSKAMGAHFRLDMGPSALTSHYLFIMTNFHSHINSDV